MKVGELPLDIWNDLEKKLALLELNITIQGTTRLGTLMDLYTSSAPKRKNQKAIQRMEKIMALTAAALQHAQKTPPARDIPSDTAARKFGHRTLESDSGAQQYFAGIQQQFERLALARRDYFEAESEKRMRRLREPYLDIPIERWAKGWGDDMTVTFRELEAHIAIIHLIPIVLVSRSNIAGVAGMPIFDIGIYKKVAKFESRREKARIGLKNLANRIVGLLEQENLEDAFSRGYAHLLARTLKHIATMWPGLIDLGKIDQRFPTLRILEIRPHLNPSEYAEAKALKKWWCWDRPDKIVAAIVDKPPESYLRPSEEEIAQEQERTAIIFYVGYETEMRVREHKKNLGF